MSSSPLARLIASNRDSRKTVTFGDSSAVKPHPLWSVFALIVFLALWWAVTNPWGLSNDFVSDTQAVATADGGEKLTQAKLIQQCDIDRNNCGPDSYTQILNPRAFTSPGDTVIAFRRFFRDGYRNHTAWEYIFASLRRVGLGLLWGILFGVPIGFAMGLSGRLSSFFDVPVELLRPIPPLAILPIFIIWFGIGDPASIRMLIFASIWIMIIAARAGARTANLSKVRAAYSLGASKRQVLTRVILPNALPELFTGIRVALGVSWGTLVAAELVGTDLGLGAMIFIARDFGRVEIILVGIVIIAVLGVLMDLILRFLESRLIPWQGKG